MPHSHSATLTWAGKKSWIILSLTSQWTNNESVPRIWASKWWIDIWNIAVVKLSQITIFMLAQVHLQIFQPQLWPWCVSSTQLFGSICQMQTVFFILMKYDEHVNAYTYIGSLKCFNSLHWFVHVYATHIDGNNCWCSCIKRLAFGCLKLTSELKQMSEIYEDQHSTECSE